MTKHCYPLYNHNLTRFNTLVQIPISRHYKIEKFPRTGKFDPKNNKTAPEIYFEKSRLQYFILFC